MRKGAFSTAEGKPKCGKYFCSGKDNQDPRVLKAEDEGAALALWAGITGRRESDGQARPIGSQAKTIAREVKPQAAPADKESKGEKTGK